MGIDIKNKYFPCLDCGFVSLKDYMGSDHDIAESARVSYSGGTKSVSDDRNLIRYLMRHRHTSPFEMAELKFHIAMPYFTDRQFVRHRTFSRNEYSGRYSVIPTIFYTPNQNRYVKQSKHNKQGSDFGELCFQDECEFNLFLEAQGMIRAQVEIHYDWCLNKAQMAKEIARIDLPLSTYTYYYTKVNLHNLLHFLKLRLDEHAQWEIRQYAKVIAGIVKELFPLTFEAFCDYVLYARTFSSQELQTLLSSSDDKNYDGMSKSEIVEFNEKIKPIKQQDSFELDYNNARDASYYEQNFLVGANND